MIFEFDEDQRLWQDTVREVVSKECPDSLVRGVVDNGVDPAALWRVYAKLGWTELTDPAEAVELAIVLEELGRAVDLTPYLATMTQFAPLAPGFAEPGQSGAAVYDGVTAQPDGSGGWLLDGTARRCRPRLQQPAGCRPELHRLRRRTDHRRRDGPGRPRPGPRGPK